jgi:dipeptidyl aminopeptidase/acylaminoacyl peptidase
VLAIVSDPATPASAPEGTALLTMSVTYVSLLPGTFPTGRTAEISNRRIGSSITVGVLGGGLDPVAVPAEAGDTLAFAVDTGGTAAVRFDQVVPQFYAVTVVRTEPPAGKRDVPLNLRARIVFSEPVDRATVSEASLGIEQNGSPVAGTVSVSADGLDASFQPAAPLLPATQYTLTAGTAIRDADGSALAAPLAAGFTTTAAEEPTALRGVLAFTASGGISVSNVDGSGRRTLTPDNVPGAFDYGAAWAPYGARIAFARHDGLWGAAIHVIEPDGTRLTRLSPPGAYDADPTWSPDGGRIAFENRKDNQSGGQIFVMDADGRNRIQVTNGRQPSFEPAWSPDGARIAYVTYADPGGMMGIYLIDPDGSDPVRLLPDTLQGQGPAWSPDGRRIAFSAYARQGSELFVINADGTGLTQLTTELGGVAQPTWSPDGENIAFTVYSGCDPWSEPCTGNEVVLPPFWVIRLSSGRASPLNMAELPIANASWQPTNNGYWDY